ncbi:hypothetical protein [Streptomyces sp. G-G2]|uniref:hypothetical protein n=1 Tax=Streptomyces sp. G-G2 TaxID=3046201 RepID=UPI0024BAC2E3|nr:hypothetical protein [Streptomyces sp. G-G2]MDJ0383076.1 hypothetical protein [Streptomyces sp. G-G2]
MSADGVSPATQWPPTPAWMSECAECVRLYGTMRQLHGVPEARTRLARHLANMHLEHIPYWAPGCEPCGEHRQALDRASASGLLGAGVSWLAAEHRASHLFAPRGASA